MGDPRHERFELTEQQREWLATLTPPQRHAAMDMLISAWYLCRSIAESADNLVDLMMPHQTEAAAADFLMSMALQAEGLRALARGDVAQADEHFEAARRYESAAGPAKIVIREQRGPDPS
jgi:hypothetical protein